MNECDQNECNHSDTYKQEGITVCRKCGMETCEHLEIDEIDGINVCIYCGNELSDININKNWKFYNDTKTKYDISRCHKRKDEVKNIYDYVEGKNIVWSIIANANEKYIKIRNSGYRAKNNKAIITMCLYTAYIDENEPRTLQEIARDFGLNNRNISKASIIFYDHFPEYLNKYIYPSDLLRRILIKTGIHMSHYVQIKKLCETVEKQNSDINNSNPQSIACAMTYLYVRMNPELQNEMGLTKKKFLELVNISDITITKICKNTINELNFKNIKI